MGCEQSNNAAMGCEQSNMGMTLRGRHQLYHNRKKRVGHLVDEKQVMAEIDLVTSCPPLPHTNCFALRVRFGVEQDLETPVPVNDCVVEMNGSEREGLQVIVRGNIAGERGVVDGEQCQMRLMVDGYKPRSEKLLCQLIETLLSCFEFIINGEPFTVVIHNRLGLSGAKCACNALERILSQRPRMPDAACEKMESIRIFLKQPGDQVIKVLFDPTLGHHVCCADQEEVDNFLDQVESLKQRSNMPVEFKLILGIRSSELERDQKIRQFAYPPLMTYVQQQLSAMQDNKSYRFEMFIAFMMGYHNFGDGKRSLGSESVVKTLNDELVVIILRIAGIIIPVRHTPLAPRDSATDSEKWKVQRTPVPNVLFTAAVKWCAPSPPCAGSQSLGASNGSEAVKLRGLLFPHNTAVMNKNCPTYFNRQSGSCSYYSR
jgi:hypothetical protein